METKLLKISEEELKSFETTLRNNEALKDLQLTKAELLILHQLAAMNERLKKLEERC